jgi:hypothetical protein
MSQKSNDLLLYLRQNKSLKSSTIQSLISYGFDSNETLIALDFDLDFDQMKDICLGQKSILRNILNELKINENKSIDKNESIFDNCIESQLLFGEMKYLLNANNHKNYKQLNELHKNIEQKDKQMKKYENESKIRDKKIENLKTKLKEMQEREQELKNEFKKQMSVNENDLKEMKTLLLTRSQTNKTQNSRNKERVVLINISDETSNESSFDETIIYENIESNDEKNICKTNKKRNIVLESLSRKPNKKKFMKCDQNIVKNNGLKEDINAIHKKEKLFECNSEECDKNFLKINSKLQTNRDLGLKPFKCQYNDCNKCFGTKSVLKQHIYNKHTKKDSFNCDFENCNKKFKFKLSLKLHMNRHLGIKPFKCHYKECDKSYVTSILLSNHIRIFHNKIKPFECNFTKCGQMFGTKQHLDQHIRNRHQKH